MSVNARSEEWREIQEVRRPIGNLSLSVSADATIEIWSRGHVVHRANLSANQTHNLNHIFDSPVSIRLRSSDPNCQCQIQAEYIEDTTTLPLALDMRFLYGPMGLGIPMPVSGNPLDVSSLYVNRSPYADVGDRPDIYRPSIYTDRSRRRALIRRELVRLSEGDEPIEQVKEDKPQTPVPGITRLQAFKRELEEEKPKKKEVKKKK